MTFAVYSKLEGVEQLEVFLRQPFSRRHILGCRNSDGKGLAEGFQAVRTLCKVRFEALLSGEASSTLAAGNVRERRHEETEELSCEQCVEGKYVEFFRGRLVVVDADKSSASITSVAVRPISATSRLYPPSSYSRRPFVWPLLCQGTVARVVQANADTMKTRMASRCLRGARGNATPQPSKPKQVSNSQYNFYRPSHNSRI